MAVSVKITQKPKSAGYPILMESTDGSGMIVKFTSKHCGTVIVVGNQKTYKEFEYHDDWGVDYFSVFNGSITMVNKAS